MSGARLAAARAPSQLFLHCRRDGEILWMSEPARRRLGPARNLLQALSPERNSEARRLLDVPVTPREAVEATFGRPGQSPLRLRLSRLLATGAGVLLAAEARERQAETPAETADLTLLRLHRQLAAHYFRLLCVRDRLERQAPRRTPKAGAWAAEQIERDRTRVARELHSGAGQALAGILLNLELLESALPGAPPAVRNSLQRLGVLAHEALQQVRGVAQRLHAPEWQRLPLARALETLWRNMGIPERFEAQLQIQESAVEPPQAVRVLLYRAAQETLSNVIRHARATRVSMRLDRQAGRIRLLVEDNGAGFDAARQMEPGAGSGIGLRSLREQVQFAGGSFQLSSTSGCTQAVVILPLMEFDE